jgi:heavy metal efflux system protein
MNWPIASHHGRVSRVVLRAPGGELVRLNRIADLNVVSSPEQITRENARRRIVVQTHVRGTDLGSFVAAAQAKVASALRLPEGYSIEWGGKFENQQRADQRLAIVLPVSIAIIFALLFATFQNVGETFLILLIVPFALVGGWWEESEHCGCAALMSIFRRQSGLLHCSVLPYSTGS